MAIETQVTTVSKTTARPPGRWPSAAASLERLGVKATPHSGVDAHRRGAPGAAVQGGATSCWRLHAVACRGCLGVGHSTPLEKAGSSLSYLHH